ncbi:MAG: peptidoglycan DD-metalloendopeptidase family protein, partial [Pirellulaceae bacterium]|nr:peptidoglycan DD-metalloendopeptidase family protein [Pirellulaceae bacterium]
MKTACPSVLTVLAAIFIASFSPQRLVATSPTSPGAVVSWGEQSIPSSLYDGQTIVQIAANNGFSFALKQNGTVVVWGTVSNGQGNVPSGLTDVIQVAPGTFHCLALRNNGTVVAWGLNTSGQSNVPLGLNNVVQIAAGSSRSLALKTDGTVVAWGYATGPNSVPNGLAGVVQIASGHGHDLALKRDGTVVAWGYNPDGQTSVPAGLVNVAQIASADSHNLAVKSDGTVAAWGSNAYGESSVPAGLGNVIQVAAGNIHSVALKADGTVVAWGNNSSGQSTVPSGLSNVVQVAAAGQYSLALKSDGTVVTWGKSVPAGVSNVVQVSAWNGRLALKSDGTVAAWGGNTFGTTSVPVGVSNVVQIAEGGGHSLALKSDGTVAAWGSNYYGQSSVPAGLGSVVQVAAGGSVSLALKANGTVVGWGLGNGNVPAGLANVVQLSAGGSHNLALRNDGTVVAWGSNSYGQRTVPSGLTNVIQVAAGYYHSLALKSDGAVVAWGRNNFGQSTVPPGLGNVVQIAVGGHSLALKSDGTVSAWGDNSAGQCSIPAGLSNVVQIAAGSDLSLAIVRLGPTISGVAPSPVTGSNARQNFTIQGANFDPNCTVTLRDRRTGLVYPNRSKTAQTSTSITLNPSFGAASASWSVEVINPGGDSTGEYAFSVQAPLSFPEITSTGLETITAGSTPQTLTLNGHDFAPNTTVTLRSLVTGEVINLVTSFVDSTRVFLSSIFSHGGKWSVTTHRPDGQTSQPKSFSVTEDTDFRLSFPLLAGDPNGNKGAYKAGINTIFDHKMGKALESGNYGITTFCGDECTTPAPAPNEIAIYNKNGDPLRNFLPVPSLLSQMVNYRLVVPACAYDNHAGIDYHGIDGVTPVYAGAGGVLEFLQPNSPTAGSWVRIKHDDSGYATGYLHLNRFAKGLEQGGRVVEGQYLGLVGKTGGVGQHLHFEVRNSGGDRFYDPYGWTGQPNNDPYTMLTGGLVNKPLWRDLPNQPIYVFPVAFAGDSDPSSNQQVTNPAISSLGGQRTISLNTGSESYTAAVAGDAASWLTITSGGSGSGQATITFSVAENFGAKRTGKTAGKIIVQPTAGGQRVVTVEQEAAVVTASNGSTAQLSGSAKTASGTSTQLFSNPANEEIATELKRAAQEHQIPANILAAVAYVGSAWQQFDGGGNPFVGADGRIGIMQIDTQNPVVPMDVPRVSVDWRYNIEIGCRILRKAWRNRLGDSLSPYDDENDADPAILENWFHPVAWQHGTGAPAYAFVGNVWSVLKSPQAPVSAYFGAVSDLGDPRNLAGFPTTIGSAVPEPAISSLAIANPSQLVASGKSTLM